MKNIQQPKMPKNITRTSDIDLARFDPKSVHRTKAEEVTAVMVLDTPAREKIGVDMERQLRAELPPSSQVGEKVNTKALRKQLATKPKGTAKSAREKVSFGKLHGGK